MRKSIDFTDRQGKRLAEMAKETGLSQSTLVNLATMSLVANYEKKGSFIFADLLNPEHRDV